MDLTRPKPRKFWELLRCCKAAAADSGDDDFHDSIAAFKYKDLPLTALDSPQTQSTAEADFSFGSNSNEDDHQILIDDISEVVKEEVGTRGQSSSNKEWHQQSLKAAIEKSSDEFKDDSFDDASVIFDNLTDFAEQLHQEVDNVVSTVVDALFK
ncbi:hypothetical protein ACHAXM_009995 [Skeletonema potamos]